MAKNPKSKSAVGASVLPATNQAKFIELLGREEGATIKEIGEATHWLPHSTRAALTGLRKRGWTVSSTKDDGVRRYRAAKVDDQ